MLFFFSTSPVTPGLLWQAGFGLKQTQPETTHAELRSKKYDAVQKAAEPSDSLPLRGNRETISAAQ